MPIDTDHDCCSVERRDEGARDTTNCPSCGHKGKPVPAITIESLVTEDARARAGRSDGFRFCADPGCEVAYFHPESGARVLRGEVQVAIGQKETAPERTVCYCFDHTAAEVEAEVAATGTSRIPDEIGDKCKQGLDRCEETNPQGSCCLGNVRRVLKDVQARGGAAGMPRVAGAVSSAATADCCAVEAEAPTGEKATRNVGLWATGGAVVSAVLSSACCWLPLLLIVFGASAAGVSGFFEAYRPVLLGVTAVLLASGFYLVYFRKERCEPGQACAVPNPRLTRFNKIMLWVASAVVLAFALFPTYVGALLGGADGSGSAPVASAGERVFRIEGMTCEACATTLRSDLSRLPGLAGVDVSYESKTARVFLAHGGAPPSNEEIESVIEAAGYRSVLLPRATARTVEFQVEGMTCGGCSSALQSRLASVPGVDGAEVDFESKRATVRLLPDGDTDAVLAAITDQGFEGRLEGSPRRRGAGE